MDAGHFDRLTRSLSRGVTRRTLTSLLGGLGLSSVLLSRLDLTHAKKGGKKKKPCPPCKKRKAGKCKIQLPDGTPCANGGSCQGGTCIPVAPSLSPPPPGPPPPGQPSPPPPARCTGLPCGTVCCTPPPNLVVSGISCGNPPAPVCACELRVADVCVPGCNEQRTFTVDCANPNVAIIPDLCKEAGCEPPP